MSDIYHRLQLAGEEQDQEQILAVLSAMHKGTLRNDLRLLNFYREIPVNYGAWVQTVEKNFAELLVHQVQAVVIAHHKLTILKSSHFPRDVIAGVTYVNVEKSTVILSNLGYCIVRADRRMSVRVEMGIAIKACFAAPQHETEGTLHDMSLTGLSIKVPRDPGIPLSTKGELSLELPAGLTTVPASLLKVIPDGDGCRLAFEIEPSRPAELSISQFVFQRQVEIIKELKEHPGVTP
ncbi:MAG TPA: PilZ domain-containing protein [Geobacter sp.]|nr:PilZ domain-containing protein [Geobacter sp.]